MIGTVFVAVALVISTSVFAAQQKSGIAYPERPVRLIVPFTTGGQADITLVITTEASGLGSGEETKAWQQQIPNSRLLVLPGNSYHVAASDADRCAEETPAFIRSV